ncbi:MAG: RNA polymerase sigma factor [Phycisphaerales bacterium]|nr:MAG: RNA polymerase sigma factor [Phycisphaerales bacterium]
MKTKARQNESALVCAARQGDKEALQPLLGRNWAWLKGLVYSVVGDANDVDDVLQDICVRVITKIDTLREPERFRPWLAVLARRQALRYRQQKTKRPIQWDQELADRQYDERAQRLLENIEQKEQYERVLRALNSLPEKYREVFILEYVHDLTYGQIAEILDIPFTTVQIRLVRARRMILDKVSANRNRIRER